MYCLNSNEVPILWVQVDPDFQWVRGLLLEQSDTTWMNVLRYHRSANAQLDALEALGQYPSVQVRDSFREAVTTSHFYYNVRLTAAQKLAEVRGLAEFRDGQYVCIFQLLCM